MRRVELRTAWTLFEHFGVDGLATGITEEVNEWYHRELAGDYRSRFIVAFYMLNEHEVVAEHYVPRIMETGVLTDIEHTLWDANLKLVVSASFKFTPKTPPPFGLRVIGEEEALEE